MSSNGSAMVGKSNGDLGRSSTYYETNPSPTATDETVPETPPSPSVVIPVQKDKGKQTMAVMEPDLPIIVATLIKWQSMVPSVSENQTVHHKLLADSITASNIQSKKGKHSRLTARSGPIKKAKKLFSPDVRTQIRENFDDSHLMDTPILTVEEPTRWAVVASPNQPPHDR